METTHDAGHKGSPTDRDDSTTTESNTQATTSEDTGSFNFDHATTLTPVEIADLTGFQKAILAVLAEESRYGLAIKRELEDYYGTEVNHGRLYPNLDTLGDKGLVEKSELDKRTNEYALTDDGRDAIQADVQWQVDRVDLEDDEEADA